MPNPNPFRAYIEAHPRAERAAFIGLCVFCGVNLVLAVLIRVL